MVVFIREIREKTFEDSVFNSDETNIQIILHDGQNFAIKVDNEIKYSYVVSGDMGITMIVMLGGGSIFEMPVIIFQNDQCSHLIKSVPENVPEVCYESDPKGWMDTRVFKE